MSLKAKIDITTNNLKKIKNKTDTENKSENKLKSRKSDNIKSKFTFSDLLNFEDELKIIENIDIQNNISLEKKEKDKRKRKNDKNISKDKNKLELDKNKLELDKDIVKNNNLNKNFHNNINPLIKNEVIWYSDDLDSDELEKKFSEKFKKLENNKLDSQKIFVNNKIDKEELNSDELEKKFSEKKIKKLENIFDNNGLVIEDNEVKINDKKIYDKFDDYKDDNYIDNDFIDDDYDEQIQKTSKEIKEFLSINVNNINANYIDRSIVIIYLTHIDEIKSINIKKIKDIFKLIENNDNALSKNFCNHIYKYIGIEFHSYNDFNNLNNNDNNNYFDKIKIIIEKKLEKKENKQENINLISSTKLIDDILCKNPTLTLTKKVHSEIVDCKQCILPCLKINDNIFEWDTNCDPNYSSYKLLNNLGISFLSSIIFIKDGEKYYPEKVDIYIQDKYIKSIYKELIVGLDSNFKKSNYFNSSIEEKEYNITNSPLPLLTNSKIKIIITDTNKIDQTLFSVYYEKADIHLKKNLNIKKELFDGLCETHDILYTGNQSNIKITDLHGYYTDIRIVCDDIKNNIKSISLKNTDVTILKDIPIKLFQIKNNIIGFSSRLNSDFSNNKFHIGFKIDQENTLEIELNKIHEDIDVKIYGKKLILLDNLPELYKQNNNLMNYHNGFNNYGGFNNLLLE